MQDYGIETQRSFVNTWECDENDHLNVQFYWKRFQDAATIHALLTGTENRNWVDRHVRYHSELAGGASTLVKTGNDSENNQTVHTLLNAETGNLSATAIDRYDMETRKGFADDIPEEAHPRSLPSNALEIIETSDVLNDGRGLVSHMSVVSPAQCDPDGAMLDQHYISRFSDAASHFWKHIGVPSDWVDSKGLGSVAVEMKATRFQPVKCEMAVQVVTWIDQIFGRSFSFRHQVSDIETKNVLYCGAVTALLMDLTTRRAVDLPDIIKNRYGN